MADGLRCKYCGYQQGSHEVRNDNPDYVKVRKGYRKSLLECSGFDLSRANIRLARKYKAQRDADDKWVAEVHANRTRTATIAFQPLARDLVRYAAVGNWLRTGSVRPPKKE